MLYLSQDVNTNLFREKSIKMILLFKGYLIQKIFSWQIVQTVICETTSLGMKQIGTTSFENKNWPDISNTIIEV